MLARSSRSFGDGSGYARSATFGNDHSISAGSVGSTQNRPQIVRIFHAIEHNHKRIMPTLGSYYVIKIVVLLGRGDRHDTLARRVSRHSVKLHPLQEAHWHTDAPAIFNQSLQATMVAL